MLHPLDSWQLSVRLVQEKMWQHRFHMDSYAARFRIQRGTQRFLARQMYDIAGRSRILKEGRKASGAFGFDRLGTARFVPFGPDLALREKLLLQARHQLRVFAVGCDDHAKALGEFEGLVHFAVIDAKKILVSQKDFERSSAVGDDLPQLRFGFRHKLGYRHMERVIARAVTVGFRLPELVAVERIVIAIRAAHFDVSCRSADKRRNAAGLVRIFCKRRHEWEIDMHVRIDEARENQLAGGIDNFGVRRGRKIFADSRDGLVLDVNIALYARAHGYDFPVSNQQSHRLLPQSVIPSILNESQFPSSRDTLSSFPSPRSLRVAIRTTVPR